MILSRPPDRQLLSMPDWNLIQITASIIVPNIHHRVALVLRDCKHWFGFAALAPKMNRKPMPTHAWISLQGRVHDRFSAFNGDMHTKGVILPSLEYLYPVMVQVVKAAARAKQISARTFLIIIKLELHSVHPSGAYLYSLTERFSRALIDCWPLL